MHLHGARAREKLRAMRSLIERPRSAAVDAHTSQRGIEEPGGGPRRERCDNNSTVGRGGEGCRAWLGARPASAPHQPAPTRR